MPTSDLPFAAARLLDAVAPDAPCGPDLDAAGDPDFLTLVARAEGLLPASFFTRDEEGRPVPFDRTSLDAAAELTAIGAMLARTRDLRLLTLAARFGALDRDLPGLAACLTGIAALLAERWDGVHPQAEEGDHALRAATLQALDDMPTVVLPLQHVVLAESRRHGPLTFRRVMAAAGEVAPGADEPLDPGTVERILADADPEALAARRAALAEIRDAAQAIRRVTAERIGPSGAVSLDRLSALAGRMLALLGSAAPVPAPAQALEPDATPLPRDETVPPGSVAEAAGALASVAAYFARAEPSCPAALLVAQARQLVGRSFAEAIAILLPAHADQAQITVGRRGETGFALPVAQLASLDAPAPPAEAEEEAPAAASRAEALGLLRRVAAFYRLAEPSSPVALLAEQACGLVDRDFLSLLRDALPGASLAEPAS
ncbi:ImpA family type VI secretion system protein [Methylobacterium nodulans]|uniref:ImpA N-terminal domain-containing protein n=1 Tax=Methylobacterium nodulans (strain LMG 21967 / CNCM I-2342 / ORS 2060) TaxID=460265 RepID=B8IIB4_METNO|nr:type VI secretion system ImpA family N-terminal domain-containing protein [Methylobacterium nodulans]ACL57983.1 conserved hypothetical protein [Methylobacterium nodulans ORS 2060]